MEGIAKIKEKILEEAQEEKQKIIQRAKIQADKIKEEYESKAASIKSEILHKADKEAQEQKHRIISMAKLENRKSLLQAKQQIIDDVFDKAKQQIKKMPDEEYQNIITDMLLKSVKTGDEEIIISSDDKNRISEEFLTKINEKLKELGKKGNLTISNITRPMIGGFILKSRDLEVNNTFDSLLNAEREEIEIDIARKLFEE